MKSITLSELESYTEEILDHVPNHPIKRVMVAANILAKYFGDEIPLFIEPSSFPMGFHFKIPRWDRDIEEKLTEAEKARIKTAGWSYAEPTYPLFNEFSYIRSWGELPLELQIMPDDVDAVTGISHAKARTLQMEEAIKKCDEKIAVLYRCTPSAKIHVQIRSYRHFSLSLYSEIDRLKEIVRRGYKLKSEPPIDRVGSLEVI